MDSLLGANNDLLSYNLFIYCSNNPINMSDPSGHFILASFSIGIVAVGTLFLGDSLYQNNKTVEISNKPIFIGILVEVHIGLGGHFKIGFNIPN